MNSRERIASSWQIIFLIIATIIAFAWLLAYQVIPTPLTSLDSKISEHMPDYSFIGVSLYQALSAIAGFLILCILIFATGQLLPLIFKNRLSMLFTTLAASGAFWVLCRDYWAGVVAFSIYVLTYFSIRVVIATDLWSNLEYIKLGRRIIYALVFAFIAATFLATDPEFVAQLNLLLISAKTAIPSNILFGFSTSFIVGTVSILITVVAAITIGGRFFAVVMYHWIGSVSLFVLFLLFGHEKIGILFNIVFSSAFISITSIWPIINFMLFIVGGVIVFTVISDGALSASIIQHAKNEPDNDWLFDDGDALALDPIYSSFAGNINHDD